jgi:tetratricopeptide (TPR) repeat protein
LKYYEKFVEHFPDNAQSLRLIGGFNKRMGHYNKAKEYLEKAQVLKPDDVSISLLLAEIEKMLGNFDEALQQYNESLKQCKTANQKADVYGKLAELYDTRGQLIKAQEYHSLYLTSFKKFSPPLMTLLVTVITLNDYMIAGQEEEAFTQLNLLKSEFPPALEPFASIGFVRLYLKLKNVDEAAKRLPAIEKFIKEKKVEQLMGFIYSSKGKINELRGEYRQAIENFQSQLKINPSKTDINRDLGGCYRHLKQYKEAEEMIKKTLKVDPFDPKANYELALVYLDQGEKEKAITYLKVALDVWKNADPNFKPAQQALQKMAEIQPENNQ